MITLSEATMPKPIIPDERVHIGFRAPAWIKERLRDECYLRRESQNDLIVRALEEFFERSPERPKKK
jgi:hypothetical protein